MGAPTSSGNDLNTIYVKDDLETLNNATSANAFFARWITTGGVGIVDLQDGGHYGVWKLPAGAAVTLNQYNNLYALTSVQKAVARFVLMADNSPETGTFEWYAGLYYTVTGGNFPCGVLFSQA